MIFRPEKHSDLGSIRSVHTVSFPNTNEARLVDELRTANLLRISLVAAKLHDVVGHVAFSPVIVHGAEGVGLGPVAVLPAYRRIGIGEQLIRKRLEACRKHRGMVMLWYLVPQATTAGLVSNPRTVGNCAIRIDMQKHSRLWNSCRVRYQPAAEW